MNPLLERRAFCVCGGSIEIVSDTHELVDGLIDVFWQAHVTNGHGPASSAAARLARQRKVIEWNREWGART